MLILIVLGFLLNLAENLLLARWQKLVWNIPYNGLSVVLDARTDQLMTEEIRLLVEQLMQEVVAGAKSCDCVLSHDIIDKMLDHTQKMKPYRTSMKIDYDERRPLEVEAIFGNPLRMANVALPRVEMLYQQLKFLNAKNLEIV